MWKIGLYCWSVLLLKSFNAFELDFGDFGQGLLSRPVQDTFEKYLDTDTFKILSEKSI